MLLLLLTLAFAQEAPAEAHKPAEVVPVAGLFQMNKGSLTPTGSQVVGGWVDLVKANPGWVFEVSVHSDSRGSDAFNKTLSQRRADAVVDAMIDAGVPSGRLVAVGHGEARPIASNSTSEGQAQNRRMELRKLRRMQGGATPPAGSAVTKEVPARRDSPARTPSKQTHRPASRADAAARWMGYSPELRGELGSGDERREGKEQVDAVSFDVPFDGTFEAYTFHGRDNAPATRVLGPGGRSLELAKGKSSVSLTKGRWTVEARDHKKAEGPWGLRLSGVAPDSPPAAGVGSCAMLSYLVAQTHVGMRDARGERIDNNFFEAPAVPGLPGTASIQRSDAYWVRLYEGPDVSSATAAWSTARDLVKRCSGSGWQTTSSGWGTKKLKLGGGMTWRERDVEFRQKQDDKTVVVRVVEEHHTKEAHSTLYLYQSDKR